MSKRKLESNEEILKFIKSQDYEERTDALLAIAFHQKKELLDAAIEVMLNDPKPVVRERAAWAIDIMKDERALDAFLKAMHDGEYGVRSAAGWGLVHLGKQVIPLMEEIIKTDKNPDAREMARLVLHNL